MDIYNNIIDMWFQRDSTTGCRVTWDPGGINIPFLGRLDLLEVHAFVFVDVSDEILMELNVIAHCAWRLSGEQLSRQSLL